VITDNRQAESRRISVARRCGALRAILRRSECGGLPEVNRGLYINEELMTLAEHRANMTRTRGIAVTLSMLGIIALRFVNAQTPNASLRTNRRSAAPV
jgi:hypothetical protein